MTLLALTALLACASADPPQAPVPPVAEPPMPLSPVELHVRNLRFRDNRVVFNESAAWLDAHRDEALPVMLAALDERGPEAIGVARVLGKLGEPAAVPALEAALGAGDPLAFEAARALAATSGDEAAAALRRAAGSEQPGVVRNALRGIELRGDPALCDAVTPHLEGEAAPYAEKARQALDCPET